MTFTTPRSRPATGTWVECSECQARSSRPPGNLCGLCGCVTRALTSLPTADLRALLEAVRGAAPIAARVDMANLTSEVRPACSIRWRRLVEAVRVVDRWAR